MENTIVNQELDESDNDLLNESTTETILLEDGPAEMESTNNFADIAKGMLPLFLIFFVFYFLLLRPQEKRRKAIEENIKTLKKGEKVITTGGIIGVVTKINETQDTVNLKISNNVDDVEFSKSAIVDILSRNKSN